MKDLIVLLAIVALSALFSLFPAWVMFDIIDLYNIPLLEEFKFSQLFGLLLVSRMAVMKARKRTANSSVDEVVDRFTYSCVAVTFTTLALWGLAYGIHLIIS